MAIFCSVCAARLTTEEGGTFKVRAFYGGLDAPDGRLGAASRESETVRIPHTCRECAIELAVAAGRMATIIAARVDNVKRIARRRAEASDQIRAVRKKDGSDWRRAVVSLESALGEDAR